MPLLPNQGPPLPATHTPIPFPEMARLKDAVRAQCPDGRVSVEAVEKVAKELGAPRAHVYVSLALDPNLVIQTGSEVLVAVCVGTCQAQGAVDNIEKLLAVRESRLAAGEKAFDILPRTCLDLCAHSPAAMSRSPHGTAAHPQLKPDAIEEMICTLCE